ncbi:membrane protein of unknown function（Protein of unknown function DUF4239,56-249&|uniref:bestrophin-like domain n=1 Tax=Magnetospirillum sp. XM-1 TaxID=1663591 RepID=UPI00073DFF3A|nr:DUF4239 domain-containing protein [Magnetospirillum sp. XM-1]CUW38892.1 membrane protein of unknown function\
MLSVLMLPLWAQALIFVGGAVTVAMLARWVVNAAHGGQTFGRAREAANILRQPTTTLVAMTLALSGIQVIGEFHRTEADTAREASVLERLYRDAQAYGDVQTAEFRETLVAYVESVVDKEWYAMRRMEEDPATKQIFGRMLTLSHQMSASTQREQMWLNDMMTQVNLSADLRRARISSAQASMPWIFYLVVISGTTVILCFSALLSTGPGSEAVIVSHAVVIGLTLLLVVSLDLPFSGSLGVRPDPFLAALDNIRLLAEP